MTNTAKSPVEFPAPALYYCVDADPQMVDECGRQVAWTPITVLGTVPMGERTYYRFEWFGEECYAHPGDIRWDA